MKLHGTLPTAEADGEVEYPFNRLKPPPHFTTVLVSVYMLFSPCMCLDYINLCLGRIEATSSGRDAHWLIVYGLFVFVILDASHFG